MDGPWYECVGPTKEEVINLYCKEFPESIVRKVVEDYVKKEGSFGSWRGFYSFCHKELKEKIRGSLSVDR